MENEENKNIEEETKENEKEEIKNEEEKEEKKEELKEETNKAKLPKFTSENFKEIYSKIDLIKKKHQEHKELDDQIHFSLNDYQIDKLMHDEKLKKLFEMIEPNALRYNYNFNYQKSSDFFSTYKMENSNNFYNTYKNNTNQNLDKFKSTIPGSSLNKIYSLFQEINRMNDNIIPFQKITYKKISPIQSNTNYNSDKLRSVSINRRTNFNSINSFDKQYQPVSTNQLVNSMRLNKTNFNLNDNLSNTISNFKSKKSNSLNFDFNLSNNNLKKTPYEKAVYNFSNWFDKFSGKYNSTFYANEINRLGNAIDKVGDYSSFPKKKNKSSIFYNSYPKKKYY